MGVQRIGMVVASAFLLINCSQKISGKKCSAVRSNSDRLSKELLANPEYKASGGVLEAFEYGEGFDVKGDPDAEPPRLLSKQCSARFEFADTGNKQYVMTSYSGDECSHVTYMHHVVANVYDPDAGVYVVVPLIWAPLERFKGFLRDQKSLGSAAVHSNARLLMNKSFSIFEDRSLFISVVDEMNDADVATLGQPSEWCGSRNYSKDSNKCTVYRGNIVVSKYQIDVNSIAGDDRQKEVVSLLNRLIAQEKTHRANATNLPPTVRDALVSWGDKSYETHQRVLEFNANNLLARLVFCQPMDEWLCEHRVGVLNAAERSLGIGEAVKEFRKATSDEERRAVAKKHYMQAYNNLGASFKAQMAIFRSTVAFLQTEAGKKVHLGVHTNHLLTPNYEPGKVAYLGMPFRGYSGSNSLSDSFLVNILNDKIFDGSSYFVDAAQRPGSNSNNLLYGYLQLNNLLVLDHAYPFVPFSHFLPHSGGTSIVMLPQRRQAIEPANAGSGTVVQNTGDTGTSASINRPNEPKAVDSKPAVPSAPEPSSVSPQSNGSPVEFGNGEDC